MGNKSSSPFPSYEAACNLLNTMEINHLKKSFKIISNDKETISLANFTEKCQVAVPSSQYIRKHVLPRLFAAMDSNKNQVIEFEEYVCAVALFRAGSTEDKIKILFLMYEPVKGTHLVRDNVRKLLVDSTVATQNKEVPAATLESWIADQHELSECMADMALQQFATTEHKLDLSEFITFVKLEGNVQGLLQLLPSAIDN